MRMAMAIATVYVLCMYVVCTYVCTTYALCLCLVPIAWAVRVPIDAGIARL